MDRLRARARLLIVGGWGVVVVGSVAYFAVLVHLGYFTTGQSLGSEGEIVLPVLGNTAALVAWSWLSRLRVSEEQMTLVQRAFYALGLQSLLIAGSVLASVSVAESNPSSYQLASASLICEAVGGLAVFVGFVVMAGVLTPRRELPREVPHTAGFSGLDVEDEDEDD